MRALEAAPKKSQRVYESLRSAIHSGELEPGQRLVIDELARTLGVSAIPVREALQQLAADGFVSQEPYVGASVTAVQSGSVAELFELLEALEVLSARAACRLIDAARLGEFERLLRKMDREIDEPDRWSEDNKKLHALVCEAAAMPLVRGILVNVFDQWDRVRRSYLSDVFTARIPQAQRQHWELLEALKTRDAEQVERVLEAHNRAASANFVSEIERRVKAPAPAAPVRRRATAVRAPRGRRPARAPRGGRP